MMHPLLLVHKRIHHVHYSTTKCYHLTSLAVIPSLSRGRATMQKTVIPTLTRGTVTWPDVCDNVIRVALRCGWSVVNWLFAAICWLSSVLAITHRSTDTASCSNHCQLMCSRKCSLFLLFRGCDANVESCRVRLCKIMNTSFTTFSSQRAVMLWHPHMYCWSVL